MFLYGLGGLCSVKLIRLDFDNPRFIYFQLKFISNAATPYQHQYANILAFLSITATVVQYLLISPVLRRPH